MKKKRSKRSDKTNYITITDDLQIFLSGSFIKFEFILLVMWDEKISREEFKKLTALVYKKILTMPDNSIIWTPDFTAGQIGELADMVLILAGEGAGDRIEFNECRIILGKRYPETIGAKYRNKKEGSGIIICPYCFEKDEKNGRFEKYNVIHTGNDMKLKRNRLELTCGECSNKTILKPNEVVELGYGKLNVRYGI